MRAAFNLNQPIHKLFLKIVNKFPTKQCVLEVETGRTMNFLEFNEYSNKYANFFKVLFKIFKIGCLKFIYKSDLTITLNFINRFYNSKCFELV